jgi:hypothetical protein
LFDDEAGSDADDYESSEHGVSDLSPIDDRK